MKMSQILYYGGPIITMDQSLYADAVLVEDGIIRFVGGRREAELFAGSDIKRVNLGGYALLPSFIDSHSHITALARTISLLHLEEAKSFEDILSRAKKFVQERNLKPGEWVVGFGYDHNFLAEKQHPDKALLDTAVFNHPMLITHASGHMGVFNSMALRAAGITGNTPDPPGGKIGRCPGSTEPNGYLEETAFIQASSMVPAPTADQLCNQLAEAQKEYFKYGITTIQDGITRSGEWQLLRTAAEKGIFRADVISFVDLENSKDILMQHSEYVKKYCGRLKIGGYKIFLDGSPQGRTAWLTQPYQDAADGYRGYPVHSDDVVQSFVRTAAADGMQLLAHCNGDAAADQFISACQHAPEIKTQRPVMIHAQLLRRDQLSAMAACGMLASFFAAHIFHWGDIHRKNLGDQRAFEISPVASARDSGIVYTFHQDSPVIPPDMMETLWCAVNRISGDGIVMGTEERIGVPDALRGVTVNAAYQYFEEKQKGSIAPDKLADLVVLDKDPLTADPMELKDIRVLQTIKEGKELL